MGDGAATTVTCNQRKDGMGNDTVTGSMADTYTVQNYEFMGSSLVITHFIFHYSVLSHLPGSGIFQQINYIRMAIPVRSDQCRISCRTLCVDICAFVNQDFYSVHTA